MSDLLWDYVVETTVANLSIISCSSEYSSLKAHTAKFFVVKDHLSDSVLQALTTEGLSMQRAWHDTCA